MITLDITPVRLVFTDYVGVTLISPTARILCRRLTPPVFPANSSDMREKCDVPERQTGGEVSPLHPLFFFFFLVCVCSSASKIPVSSHIFLYGIPPLTDNPPCTVAGFTVLAPRCYYHRHRCHRCVKAGRGGGRGCKPLTAFISSFSSFNHLTAESLFPGMLSCNARHSLGSV